jgi:hypothetical protein
MAERREARAMMRLTDDLKFGKMRLSQNKEGE